MKREYNHSTPQHIIPLYSGTQRLNLFLCLCFSLSLSLQAQVADTVTVELASTSRVVFTMEDRSDLPQLRAYDYQALFDDILLRLEQRDTTGLRENTGIPSSVTGDTRPRNTAEDEEDLDEVYGMHPIQFRYRNTSNRVLFNADLGYISNYFENGRTPVAGEAPYAVRTWGSWNIGLNLVHQTRFGKHFSLEWSFGVSWHNYKFDNPNIHVVKADTGTEFIEDPRNLNFTKSKLTTSYFNVMLVPEVIFGGRAKAARKGRDMYAWEAFRIGVGAYAGHRLGSYTKHQYLVNGDKVADKERNNFHLQDLRYGIRVQFGLVSTVDFFFNVDLNPLFTDGKGPDLRAYSFGLVF